MTTLSPTLRIGVLRGGPSPEYDLSLLSGANVLKTFSETHRPLDIFISRDGKWHMQGIERSPERILKNVDVVFNALYGKYGEDGGVQEVLAREAIPYTGSERFPSALAMNKWITKEHAISLGIKTPISFLVRGSDPILDKAKEIWGGVTHPLVVKPALGGFSVSFNKIDSFPEFVDILQNVSEEYGNVLVEEYIGGKEVSCIVTDNFRGQNVYTFPILENVSKDEANSVSTISKQIHKILGLRHYSESNFVVSPKRGVYFLETNTLPKLNNSNLPKSLDAVGSSLKDFLHHLIRLAIYETGIWL